MTTMRRVNVHHQQHILPRINYQHANILILPAKYQQTTIARISANGVPSDECRVLTGIQQTFNPVIACIVPDHNLKRLGAVTLPGCVACRISGNCIA